MRHSQDTDPQPEHHDTIPSQEDTHMWEYSDTQTQGDPMSLPKDSEVTRFYLQNPNGFNLGRMGSLETALEHVKTMEVDHCMFPEPQLDTVKYWVRSKFTSTAGANLDTDDIERLCHQLQLSWMPTALGSMAA